MDIIGKIFYTKSNNEEYIVTKYLGKQYYEIQFSDGHTKKARRDHIMHGNIRHEKTYDPNKIYSNKKGFEYIITNYEPSTRTSRYVRIKFLQTGTENVVRLEHALSGAVWDPSIPKIFGVGSYGSPLVPYNDPYVRRMYVVWYSMHARCYNEKHKAYKNYGLIGIIVCERWHKFEFFLDDVIELLNFEKMIYDYNYELDKDLIPAVYPVYPKIYSPETCVFLSKQDNLLLSRSNNDPEVARQIYNKILFKD